MDAVPHLKKIVLYENTNAKKFRLLWLGTVVQVGFILFTAFVTPTKKRLAEARRKYKLDKEQELHQQQSNMPTSSDLGELTHTHSEVPSFEIEQPSYELRMDGFSNNYIVEGPHVQQNPGIAKIVFKGIINTLGNLTNPLSIGLMAFSPAICFAVYFLSRRTISKVTLLPNGNVKLSYYTLLGLSKVTPSEEMKLTDIVCRTRRTDNVNYLIMKAKNRRFFFLIDKTEGNFYKPELFDQTIGRRIYRI